MHAYKIPSQKNWDIMREALQEYLAYLGQEEPQAVNPISACRQLLDADLGDEVSGVFGNGCQLIKFIKRKKLMMEKDDVKELSASEAIYSFAGWLTSRKERTVMSATDDAAPIAELVDQFCKSQELQEPSAAWSKRRMTYPY